MQRLTARSRRTLARAFAALLLRAQLTAAKAESLYPRYGCAHDHNDYPFCNASLPIDQRVDDLISRLTLEEKPQLMVARLSPLGNVSRLGVPQYDWGANCIHGVQSRCGTGTDGSPRCPTPFPNPNFLGATFNESVWRTMGRVIGVELRSLWRQGVGENHPPAQLPPLGLDCWSPNVNLVRDPRWGRNLETPGEDPFLLGRFGAETTRGLQEGDRHGRLQAVATLKHFVANSLEGTWLGPGGPASYPGTGLCPGLRCTRHTIDPNISSHDLAASYFPAFRAAVVEGGALGVMCSYNSVNGYPSCANGWLLGKKLRKQWGFQGYVTGDSGAVEDIFETHHFAPSMEDAVVAAVEAGTDIQSCSWPKGRPWATVNAEYLQFIPSAVRSGKLSEATVDAALRRSLALRFRLGLFDNPAGQPYERVSPDAVRSAAHVAAAVDASEQGLVLLKNGKVRDGRTALPIRRGRIALIGPHLGSRAALLGNYLGQSCPVLEQGHEQYGCVESLAEALGSLTAGVATAPGLAGVTASVDQKLLAEAVGVAGAAEHVVLALGLDTAHVEREGRDRKDIRLPPGQLTLFHSIAAIGKPLTVVILNGGIVAMTPIKQQADAIVEAWYPGFFGARAIARALLGHTNRWGKLPVTVYAEAFTEQVDMLDFDMTKRPGRTYRYYTGRPLWPFGFGLSYTTFSLRLLSQPLVRVMQANRAAWLRVEVRNTGHSDGDEVVLAFFQPLPGTVPAGSRAALLRRQLFGFKRVAVPSGGRAEAAFPLSAEALKLHTDTGDGVSYPGKYAVQLSTGNVAVDVEVEVEADSEAQPRILEPWVEQHEEAELVV